MSRQQSAPLRFHPSTGQPLTSEDQPTNRPLLAADCRVNDDAWLFDPWTGVKRDSRDVESDSQGVLIMHTGEPLYAATQETARG